MRLAKQNGGPWHNREHFFRAADGDARGEALFWCSNGPAVEPGEGQMGNVGRKEMALFYPSILPAMS